MVNISIEFLEFLLSCAPLFTSLAVLTLLCTVLAKSIRKHPAVYYILLAIPALLVTIPAILRWCGVELFNVVGVPVLGQLLRDYIHMGTFGHPLLIIIMYMGALNTKLPFVKRLMSIRKELSIISGFPVLTHALIRVANNFPNSLKFFTDNEAYMASTHVSSELGAGISSFSFVLGIVMLALFLPLWVTSFDPVHRRMGHVKWKKLQKWAYVLYATLFIHAVGIQVGGMLNPRTGSTPKPVVTEQAEVIGKARSGQSERIPTTEKIQRSNIRNGKPEENQASKAQATPVSKKHAKGFKDIQVPQRTRQYIHIVSLLLIYGSYLYLRLRKAKESKKKKTGRAHMQT